MATTQTVQIDRGALHLADHAFLETQGSNADKVRAAIWAYLWGTRNVREQLGMYVYPSLNELRAALDGAATEDK